MITCSACGAQNEEQNTFCSHCGASLSVAGPSNADALFGVGQQPKPSTPTAVAQPENPYNPPIPQAQPPVVYNPPAANVVQPNHTYGAAAIAPLKDRNLALLLEILLGLFGLFGIGRIYAGDTTTGVIWLVGGLVWDFIALLIAMFTLGIGCLCTLPINLVAMGIATYLLNEYMKARPGMFRV